MSEQDRIAFEKWKWSAKLKVKQPLIYETSLIKEAFNGGYEVATAEAEKRIDELEGEVAELKGEKVRHDQLVDYLKAGIAEELEQRILELQANNHDLREALPDTARRIRDLISAPTPQEEWDENRMDVIGQNGNDGDHY